MKKWKPWITKQLHRLDTQIDGIREAVFKRSRRLRPILITPYHSFGTNEAVYLRGRVLRGERLALATESDTRWQNLRAMYHRFVSDEMPNTHLTVRYQQQEVEVVTDHEGYYDVSVEIDTERAAERLWHSAQVDLQSGKSAAEAEILIPPENAEFGVISDIDDTILETNVTSFIKMARLTLFGNAHTRLAFQGVAALYRALHSGPGRRQHNPIFYVSGSPWNLYDFLVDFMQINGIPKGPLFLTDLGIDEGKFIKATHQEHKSAAIERILDTYPHLSFILIGDSGEHDPYIYADIVKKYPHRILAIYIRDVSQAKNHVDIQTLQNGLNSDVDMLLVSDSLAAAEHAAANGFITPAELDLVVAEVEKDRSDV